MHMPPYECRVRLRNVHILTFLLPEYHNPSPPIPEEALKIGSFLISLYVLELYSQSPVPCVSQSYV